MSSDMASPGSERNKKEQQQKLHYTYLSELQKMARDLPASYQQRLPYDLLSSLASCLLDGTVFEIVRSLKEVQQLEERALSNQRIKMLNEHKAQKAEMERKHREQLQVSQHRTHHLPYLQTQFTQEIEAFSKFCEDEMKRRDMKIILELDQKVLDQQSMLERAGVAGFVVTNNPQDVRIQMYLLDFIVRLAALER